MPTKLAWALCFDKARGLCWGVISALANPYSKADIEICLMILITVVRIELETRFRISHPAGLTINPELYNSDMGVCVPDSRFIESQYTRNAV